jgi:hypothetical protein
LVLLASIEQTVRVKNGLEIARWAFWSPETREPSEWYEHWSSPDARALDADVPDRDVPPAQRRRMSALATLAVQIATEAAGGVAADFLVFASQHGDVTRLRAMLDAIAAGTELSPTVFSQSVHNASAGLYTIISRSSAPVCALSSGASTFAAAWLEAEGFLSEHAEASVLLASYDEALPPEYASYSSQRVCAYALGLLVRSAHTGGIELEPAPAEGDEPLPMAPLFIAWLLSGERSLRITADGRGWIWRRTGA